MCENCVECGIGEILFYVGGNLVIGKYDFFEIEIKFKGMGFNCVFVFDIDLELVCFLMKCDIECVMQLEEVVEGM